MHMHEYMQTTKGKREDPDETRDFTLFTTKELRVVHRNHQIHGRSTYSINTVYGVLVIVTVTVTVM